MINRAVLYGFLTIIFFGSCGNLKNKKAEIKAQVYEGNHIVCDSGIVVSAHSESSRIGVAVLKKGGNAIDAAVAVEFALAVCYPEAGNIGGGGFMLIREADGRTDLIDYREKAPLKSSSDMYLDSGGNVITGMSTDTHLASGVPGTVDGMINIHSKYGVLSFKSVIQPAIDLAYNGFPLTFEQATDLNNNRQNFISRNKSRTAFVKDLPWKEGDTLKQPELAGTLERIRGFGRNGFYSGITARHIVEEMKRGNGRITYKDLATYSSVFRDPVSGTYRGYKIFSAAPPSGGGIILLQILGMIEPYNLGETGFHSWQAVHLITEAERRAFADRSQYLGDPGFTDIPVEGLLSREYLLQRMSSFNCDSASSSSKILPGSPQGFVSEETTHYSITDFIGNAVAATTTLNGGFGSSIVVDSAGFLLNNQMDDFSIKQGVPNMYGLVGGKANSVEPGKRMLSSMTPVIIEKGGKLFLVAGSPGGSTIPTTVLQVIINVIDYGMNIREAVDTGRFHHQWLPDYINYEKNSIDSNAIVKLKNMGHELWSREPIGRTNAIMIMPDGSKAGGADSRGNNVACGY